MEGLEAIQAVLTVLVIVIGVPLALIAIGVLAEVVRSVAGVIKSIGDRGG